MRRLGFRIAKVLGEQKGGVWNSKKRSLLGVWTVPESIRRPLFSILNRFGFGTFLDRIGLISSWKLRKVSDSSHLLAGLVSCCCRSDANFFCSRFICLG